jgi:hypothetical protein
MQVTAFDFLNSNGEEGTITTGVQFSFTGTPGSSGSTSSNITSTLSSSSDVVRFESATPFALPLPCPYRLYILLTYVGIQQHIHLLIRV